MALDSFYGQRGVMTPADDALPLSAGDDSSDLSLGICKAFFCTADATVAVVTKAGNERSLAVAAHVIYPIRVSRLKATGTALNSGAFVALY